MTEPREHTTAASTEPASAARPSRVINAVALLLLTFSVFSLAFTPLRGSQDEWWHLKTGQWIWQHKQLPVNDIFTYTGEDLRWYNHEWLSQLIFYGIFQAGQALSSDIGGYFPPGLTWLIAFKSLIVVAVFLLVARLAWQRLHALPGGWAAACVIAVIAADVSRRTIYVRPPIFSYLLFALFLLMLYAWKKGHLKTPWLWLLVPLTVLWGNMHGMVLLAIVATGAFAAGELLENGWTWLQTQFEKQPGEGAFLKMIVTPAALQLCALTLIVALACLAQPSGYHIFFLGRNFTADPLLQQIILEMKPTPGPFILINPADPSNPASWVARPPGFWTPWIALACIIILLIRNRARLPFAADYILLSFFVYQGFMHWRLLPLFAIAAAGPTASLLAARLHGWHPRRAPWQQPLFAISLAALVGWFNFTVAEPPPHTFFRRNIQLLQEQAANTADYPVPLMDYLEHANLPPRMFSDSNYCGYFMWRLAPEKYKLFTDNRFDVFGSEFIRLERAIFFALHKGDILDGQQLTQSWDEILRHYDVNFLVFRPIDRRDLFEALRHNNQWRLVYYYVPPQAAPQNWPIEGYYVWVRNTPGADSLEQKSAEIFRQQFTNRPLPAEIWRTLTRAGTRANATGATSAN